MSGAGCKKHRKHTPIVSKKQQRLFGAAAGGKKTKATGLSKKEAKRHLRESKGKKLPEKSRAKARKAVRKWHKKHEKKK